MNWPVPATHVFRRLTPACLLLLSTGVLPAAAATLPRATAVSTTSTETIFVCVLYSPVTTTKTNIDKLMRSLGAVRQVGQWRYRNKMLGKDFVIRFVTDIEGMKQALYTDGAHIIIEGHSNYGLGGVFAISREVARQRIAGIRYLDDDRIFNYSSPWVSVRSYGMVQSQAYPDWWPIFKDGTSGIMPYDFGDPRGDPPYNYYITYQVPGDPTHYRIETVGNAAIERFPDSDRPAWYAPDGSPPDPTKPEDLQYYITNPDQSFLTTGKWLRLESPVGYYGGNFLSATRGSGDKTATWTFTIPQAGTYSIAAKWTISQGNATNAPFTITHALGSTTVRVSQKTGPWRWNKLGSFTFDAGDYSVTLSNDATGAVVADALKITHDTDPSVMDAIFDNGTSPKAHFGKKAIVFRNGLEVEPEKFAYSRMFYEGCNTGLYYLETFHRGITFYTVSDSIGTGTLPYLKSYLRGSSDAAIWRDLQAVAPVYDYYDFSQAPNAAPAPAALQMSVAGLAAPDPLTVDTGITFENELEIRRLAFLPTHEAFQRLQTPELLADADLLQAATRQAFRFRRTEAISLGLRYLTSPVMQTTGGRTASRDNDWTVARTILQVFPAQAAPRLVALYGKSDAPTRENVLLVLGGLDGGNTIDDLLLTALDDQTFCEEETAESVGEPLRLCDVAYNQLIQRYGFTDLLRTLGQAHRIKVRDYHIDVLESRLGLF